MTKIWVRCLYTIIINSNISKRFQTKIISINSKYRWKGFYPKFSTRIGNKNEIISRHWDWLAKEITIKMNTIFIFAQALNINQISFHIPCLSSIASLYFNCFMSFIFSSLCKSKISSYIYTACYQQVKSTTKKKLRANKSSMYFLQRKVWSIKRLRRNVFILLNHMVRPYYFHSNIIEMEFPKNGKPALIQSNDDENEKE